MSETITLASGITANARVSSGVPCIEGTGIRVDVICARWLEGEGILSIGHDFNLSTYTIEAALRYEMQRLRKRQPKFTVTT